MFDVTLKV